jgi:hypothetical protein
MKVLKPHILDKPILRDLFWFIVLPHDLKRTIASRIRAGAYKRRRK